MKTDLTYTCDGGSISFIPNTKAGEDAWNVMAEQSGLGCAKFPFWQKPSIIMQLKSHGYTVRKAIKSKQTMDDLLKEMEEAGMFND